jgi:hypothetical protein
MSIPIPIRGSIMFNRRSSNMSIPVISVLPVTARPVHTLANIAEVINTVITTVLACNLFFIVFLLCVVFVTHEPDHST